MTKKMLYLVRHAKSSWDFPDLDDKDRPLNKRGERNAPEMGKRLKIRGIIPDLMISSPAKRALKTCKVIAKEIGYSKSDIQIEDRMYHASTSEILAIISKVSPQHNSLMLFGHNPGFTWLANELCDVYFENVPTCGIVAVGFSVDSWESILPGEGELKFYDYPKKAFTP